MFPHTIPRTIAIFLSLSVAALVGVAFFVPVHTSNTVEIYLTHVDTAVLHQESVVSTTVAPTQAPAPTGIDQPTSAPSTVAPATGKFATTIRGWRRVSMLDQQDCGDVAERMITGTAFAIAAVAFSLTQASLVIFDLTMAGRWKHARAVLAMFATASAVSVFAAWLLALLRLASEAGQLNNAACRSTAGYGADISVGPGFIMLTTAVALCVVSVIFRLTVQY